MKIEYVPKRFTGKSEAMIEQADAICSEYMAKGMPLTLRQLYYQFVARGLLENSMRSYKNLQKLINNARLAGRIDWSAIVDRTRDLRTWPSWWGPESITRGSADCFKLDPWEEQERIVQVWVEKDALIGIVETASSKWRLPYFSCRGYVSQSEIWSQAMDLRDLNKPVTILHLGDHDPSGVDMSRDIQDRFHLFGADNVEVDRIALTMEQIRELNPPPNPAKLTDSRCASYVRKYGDKSWELDALNPEYIVELVEREASYLIDEDSWNDVLDKEEEHRKELSAISDNYPKVVKHLKKKDLL